MHSQSGSSQLCYTSLRITLYPSSIPLERLLPLRGSSGAFQSLHLSPEQWWAGFLLLSLVLLSPLSQLLLCLFYGWKCRHVSSVLFFVFLFFFWGGGIVIVFPFFLILHGTVHCSSDQCVLNISSLRPWEISRRAVLYDVKADVCTVWSCIIDASIFCSDWTACPLYPPPLQLLLQELLVLHAHSLLFLASNCLCGKHSGRCIIEKERMKRLNITRDAARTLVKHHTPKIMISALSFFSLSCMH